MRELVDRDAVVKALESGQLAGYAGDVWYPQPAPADHPWRTTPHRSLIPVIDALGRSQDTFIISEAGLYRLVMRNRSRED